MSQASQHADTTRDSDIHPGRDTLTQFINGRLDDVRSGELESHVETCAFCCRVLAKNSRQSDVFVEHLVAAVESIPVLPLARDDDSSHALGRRTLPPRIGRFEIHGPIAQGGFGFGPQSHIFMTTGNSEHGLRFWDSSARSLVDFQDRGYIHLMNVDVSGQTIFLVGNHQVERLSIAQNSSRKPIVTSTHILPIHFAPEVSCVSADGRWQFLTGDEDSLVIDWLNDASTQPRIQSLKQIPGVHQPIAEAAISPNGRYLLTNGYLSESSLLWDLETERVIKHFPGSGPSAFSLGREKFGVDGGIC